MIGRDDEAPSVRLACFLSSSGYACRYGRLSHIYPC